MKWKIGSNIELDVRCGNCKYYNNYFCNKFNCPVDPAFDPCHFDCYKQRKMTKKEVKKHKEKVEKAMKMFSAQREVDKKYFYNGD